MSLWYISESKRPESIIARIGGVKNSLLLCSVLSFVISGVAHADTQHSADDIVNRSYQVIRGYHFKTIVTEKTGSSIATIFNRASDRPVTRNTLEAYIKNDYDDGKTRSKQLMILKSGNLKGTGILVTNYLDNERKPALSIWLPGLRKIRRFSAPDYADFWMGTNLTYGDVYFRRPSDEQHELIGRETFKDCLSSMKIDKQYRYIKQIPEASCKPLNRAIYQVRSTTYFENWWYDHRITDIDAQTFVPYRSAYFKDGKLVKIIEADWAVIQHNNDQSPTLSYVYSKTSDNKHETLVVIPQQTLQFDNEHIPAAFWSERTLRKIKR